MDRATESGPIGEFISKLKILPTDGVHLDLNFLTYVVKISWQGQISKPEKVYDTLLHLADNFSAIGQLMT